MVALRKLNDAGISLHLDFGPCRQRRDKLAEDFGIRRPVEGQQAGGAQMLPRLPGVSSAGSLLSRTGRFGLTGRGLRWGGSHWRWTSVRSFGRAAGPFYELKIFPDYA
jgi:hypothetical protein